MQLNFKKFGQGQPLLILHGLFGMLDNWQTIGKQLATQFEVYLIDLRNHGKSPHDLAFDYYVMAEDVADFCEQQELENVLVIGHSMGGKVAMQLAVDQASLVEKLIVVDIAPKDYEPNHQEIFDAFFSIELAKINSRKDATEILMKQLADVGVVQFLLKNLNRTKTGYQWKCNLSAIFYNYTSIIENSLGKYDTFDKPTLFIKGGDSPRYIELPDDVTLIEQHFSDATIQTVAKAGHWVHAQQPKKLLTLIQTFLS